MTSTIKRYFTQRANRYHCDSTSVVWGWQRRREARAVAGLLGDINGLDVLDLGCGAGYYTRLLLDLGATHVTAVDFSPAMLEQLPQENVTGISSDAATVGTDRRFPAIVSAGLLEFTADPAAVLSNARALAKEGGRMVCLVPPDNFAGFLYRRFHKRHGFDITPFSVASFTGLAEITGWKVDFHRPVFPYALVFRLSAS